MDLLRNSKESASITKCGGSLLSVVCAAYSRRSSARSSSRCLVLSNNLTVCRLIIFILSRVCGCCLSAPG
jgi:hypothetical protein